MKYLRYLLAFGWKATNKPAVIGHAVLKQWRGYRFASSRMTPRFDKDGNIYMLLCDEVKK